MLDDDEVCWTIESAVCRSWLIEKDSRAIPGDQQRQQQVNGRSRPRRAGGAPRLASPPFTVRPGLCANNTLRIAASSISLARTSFVYRTSDAMILFGS